MVLGIGRLCQTFNCSGPLSFHLHTWVSENIEHLLCKNEDNFTFCLLRRPGQAGCWKPFVTFEIQPLGFKGNGSPKRATLLKGRLAVKIIDHVALLIHSWQGPGISWKSDVTRFVISQSLESNEFGYTAHCSPIMLLLFTVTFNTKLH